MCRSNLWFWLWLRKLRAKFGDACQECGADEHLEFAHKIGFRRSGNNRGRNARILEVKKHPRRFRLLCNSCHQKYDYRNPLTKKEAQAQASEAPF